MALLSWPAIPAAQPVVPEADSAATGIGRSAEDVVQAALEAGLHQHPDWLRLLQFEPAQQRSKIVSSEFFLAADGASSPAAELAATVTALLQPVATGGDDHARCRFPARYLWLDEQLGLGPLSGEGPSCARLEAWARFDQLRSISVVMVSSYFGNPASSFGHLLLKLNNSEEDPGAGLLDIGINYGAAVPDSELTAIYVLRGLFGGYQAGFSDRLYYTQDLTYSRVEFRDMWEYELALEERQLRLLVFHLWEMIGQRFRYYFLKENCAFRLAELLQLVTGEDFTGDARVWYAPVSFFHRLVDINEASGGQLITQVRFIPSSQRILHHEFSRLGDAERPLFNRLVRQPALLREQGLPGADDERRAAILDVLLAYYQYRLAPLTQDESSAEAMDLRRQKEDVLRLRLRLPPSGRVAANEIEPLSPPADGSKPTMLGAGIVWNSEFGSYLRARYAAFHYDSVGNNNLDGSELVVLDLALGLVEGQGIFLDGLDFVRARKLNLDTARIAGESSWSWQVATGLKRDNLSCAGCAELYAGAGIGRARPFGQLVSGYLMLNGSVETRGDAVVIEPVAGLQFSPGGSVAGRAELGWEKGLGRETDRWSWMVESRWSPAVNREVRVLARRRDAIEVMVGAQLYW